MHRAHQSIPVTSYLFACMSPHPVHPSFRPAVPALHSPALGRKKASLTHAGKRDRLPHTPGSSKGRGGKVGGRGQKKDKAAGRSGVGSGRRCPAHFPAHLIQAPCRWWRSESVPPGKTFFAAGVVSHFICKRGWDVFLGSREEKTKTQGG